MATRKLPRVVVCAAVTADGKLAEVPALPPMLYTGGADPVRHPWARLYDGAAGILWDGESAATLPMPPAARRTVIAVHLERGGEAEEARREVALALRRVSEEGMKGNVLCFGGAGLFRILLEGGWVDELRLIVLPVVDGRRDAPSLGGPGGAGFFPASVACRLVKMEAGAAGEGLLHYRVVKGRRREAVETAEGVGGPLSPG